MENQPPNPGIPKAANTDPTNQAERFADGRGISDLTKNKGKKEDKAAYADDKARTPEDNHKSEGEKQADTRPEDFEPFHLDEVEEKPEEES